LQVRGPDAGVLAQPRREVALPRQPVAFLDQPGVDQLAQLGRGIVGSQDLAGGGEGVLAPVALRLDGRLEVERRARWDQLGRVGVATRAGLAARDGDLRKPPFITPCCTGSCARPAPGRDLGPLAKRLEIDGFRSDIRPALKECGANDDKCVARWEEVG